MWWVYYCGHDDSKAQKFTDLLRELQNRRDVRHEKAAQLAALDRDIETAERALGQLILTD